MDKNINLSPSNADRYLTCLGSVYAEAQYEKTKSKYAREGDIAHAVLDKCLKELLDPLTLVGHTIEAGFNKERCLVTQEIGVYIQEVLEYVMGVRYRCAGELYSELKVYLEWIREKQTGVIDVLIPEVSKKTLHVMDLKFGKGVRVDAEKNAQLMLYAFAAMQSFVGLYPPFETVKLHIMQPRREHYDVWEVSLKELTEWVHGTVMPTIVRIKNGSADSLPRNPSEKACKFCRANAECRALADKNLSTVVDGFNVAKPIESLSDSLKDTGKLNVIELFECLDAVGMIKAWCDAIKDKAVEYLKNGYADHTVGWKLVDGKTNRVWLDEDKAEQILSRAGLKQNERRKYKLISPHQAEKLLGKGSKALDSVIYKPKGAPTLARISDERRAIDVFEGFENKAK